MRLMGRRIFAAPTISLDVAWMVLHDFLPQGCGVKMSVNFRCAYAFMAEQLLDYAQVGPALEQGRGKRVAERVRADGLAYARSLSLPLHHDEYHGARKVTTPAIEEHVVLLTGLWRELVAARKPPVKLAQRPPRDGHKSLL